MGRIRRSEKRQAKQQAYHDGEMQRIDNDKMNIEAETEKQMQEIIQERREAELHNTDLRIETLTYNIKKWALKQWLLKLFASVLRMSTKMQVVALSLTLSLPLSLSLCLPSLSIYLYVYVLVYVPECLSRPLLG